MFKRQMDSLSIYNLDYSSYLPESTCQDLVEVLTEVSEKELRFVSSFHPCKIVTGEKRRTVHDYDILERIIVDEYRCSKAFYITHNNRQPLVHY
ncbi:hypothetical protein PFISCL1PPCAC_11932 [Pristionchus fissidentatus]|uniref:Uncharacterized protein n=1 Tax=Pristionchus fissidentatus TaxID=1538716 RepID=A0AAV5VPQ0_9BILA|nr:hypothetical protein PFISCL1PPCAC_11932 [Pristionchus fissidentatus]